MSGNLKAEKLGPRGQAFWAGPGDRSEPEEQKGRPRWLGPSGQGREQPAEAQVGLGWVLGPLSLVGSRGLALESVGKYQRVLCSVYDCCFGISWTVWKAA